MQIIISLLFRLIKLKYIEDNTLLFMRIIIIRLVHTQYYLPYCKIFENDQLLYMHPGQVYINDISLRKVYLKNTNLQQVCTLFEISSATIIIFIKLYLY